MNFYIEVLYVLVVTNPILIWLYEHGWEDPNWGQRIIVVVVGLVCGLGAAYMFSEADTATRAIAAYSGSQFAVTLAGLALRPKSTATRG